MPRKVPWPPPVYSRNGSDYVRLRLGPGQYRDVTLGPADSAESRAEYLRIVAEWEAHGRRRPAARAELTVLEASVAFLEHARGYYEYRQFHRYRTALRPAKELYGHTPARDFGPVAFAAVRQTYVAAGYRRRYVNQLAGCLRQAWKWLSAQQLVPHAVAAALFDCADLRRRKTVAPESVPVRPAHPEQVGQTLPWLPPIVADMVCLQMVTGCRPGEVCALRPCDLDRGWRVIEGQLLWLFRLDEHKTDWRGHHRWVPVGPEGQRLLLPYLDRSPDAYCFSPREVAEQWLRAHGRRVHFRRSRAPGLQYNTQAYDHVVRAACDRALIPRWAPNRLRHLVGTRIETEYGREDARCVLGHRTASTTAVYAESVERAARVIARLG